MNNYCAGHWLQRFFKSICDVSRIPINIRPGKYLAAFLTTLVKTKSRMVRPGFCDTWYFTIV